MTNSKVLSARNDCDLPKESPLSADMGIFESLLEVLREHLNDQNIDASIQNDSTSGKLIKLGVHHLAELASDMCDELERRSNNVSTPLESKSNFSSKRNHARIRMADFSTEKLNGLILDILQESERRSICPSSDIKASKRPSAHVDEITNISKRQHVQSPDLPSASKFIEDVNVANTTSSLPADVANYCENPQIIVEAPCDQSFNSPVINRSKPSSPKPRDINLLATGSLVCGMDSLSAMIDDIGSMIECDEGDEIDEIKRQYEEEISKYRQAIEDFERVIVPGKNREIASLMTRLEESEISNSRLKKELFSLTQLLADKDQMLKDQEMAHELLKSAIDQIQATIGSRASNAPDVSKHAVRREIMVNGTFSLLENNGNAFISVLDKLVACTADFNAKAFLKHLKNAGALAKCIVLDFDLIINAAKIHDLSDTFYRGDQAKSLYISTLSETLVLGKDFSLRPSSKSELNSSLDNLLDCHKNLLLISHEIQSAFDSLF